MPTWVDASGNWTPETWLVIFAGLTFLVAAIAAFVGLRQLKSNQQLADEQTRPYVQIDIGTRMGLMLFEATNIGRRPAVDVSITLDPEPTSTNAGFQANLRTVFNEDHIIEIIAPRKRLEWFVDASSRIIGQDVPQTYVATVKYKELPASGRKQKRHVEHYALSFAQYDKSALPEAGLPQLVTAAQDIASKIENLKTLQQRYGSHE